MLKRRLVGNQLLDLMLGEIADPQLAGGDDAAGLGCQLAREQPRQRVLPLPLRPTSATRSSGSMRRFKCDSTGAPGT